MLTKLPKPLIVVGPKILLRHPQAVSSLLDIQPGSHFQSVLDNNNANLQNATKLIFCSGKHYYFLQKEKEARKIDDVAIIRIEVSVFCCAGINSFLMLKNLSF